MNKKSWISKVERQAICLFAVCVTGSIIPFQESYAQVKSRNFLCDSVSPTAAAALIVASYQHKDCMAELSDIDSAKALVHILDLDVISYFDLKKLYDTEAKQNEFKQTKECKDKLAVLTTMKTEALDQFYYSVLTTSLGKFSWSFKGYKFAMDKLSTPGGVIGLPPPPSTIFYNIDLGRLPFDVSGPTDQNMVLLVDPNKGLEIDRDKDNIAVIVLYKLGSVVNKEYTYFNEQCHCNRNAKEPVIKTKYDRVLIFNFATNEVYFDETYDKTAGK